MRNRKLIARRIMGWYAENKRDLPWRRTRNPYFIWVSEIMLQQTQVETVIPYYRRFIKRFRTIKALSGASVQDVLKAWENMGYYGRARHMHQAAGEIVSRWRGRLPRTLEGLMGLPGIGTYTASAILSIAFGHRVPTVDGNVRRVLSRVFAIQTQVDLSRTQKHIHDLARELMPSQDPGHFNQAMMELGALICTPRKPSCDVCPVQKQCLAFPMGFQEILPVTRKGNPIPQREGTAAIIEDQKGRFLVVQRPERGLLGGLWTFPGGMTQSGEDLEEALERSVREELGVRIGVGAKVTAVKHAYSHFRITLHAFHSVIKTGRPRAQGCHQWKWASGKDLGRYPISRADQKVINAFLHSSD